MDDRKGRIVFLIHACLEKLRSPRERGDLMENGKTAAGTDIAAVKKANAQSGMSYNEAKEYIARTTGGHGTEIYSNTDPEQIRKKNQSK